jgi:hypothetical protein
MTSGSRHMTEAILDEFLNAGPETAVQIPGEPEVRIVFQSGEGGVAVLVAWDGVEVPDLVGLEHLSARVVASGGQAWAELAIDDAQVARRAYPILSLIIDRIQLEDQSFASAVVGTVHDFRELLGNASGLSGDREVGMIGELIVLDHLAAVLGITRAIEAWRGPDRAEHDFDLGDGDLEVKTTLSEKRVHWIGSLGQLEPMPGRRLWLLSVQLTDGPKTALTLTQRIERLRASCANADSETFDDKLYRAGWRDSYAATVRRRFQLRSLPLLLPVDMHFPALTTSRFTAAGLPLDRLRELSYSIEVTGLVGELEPPSAIVNLLTQGEFR